MRFTLDGESFELTPELVRARLAGHVPEDVREYWVEIDGIRWPVKQVISLATGVSDRQRFQSQSSRRWLQQSRFHDRRAASRDVGCRHSSTRPEAATWSTAPSTLLPPVVGRRRPRRLREEEARATERRPRTSTYRTTSRRCGPTPKPAGVRGSSSRLSTAWSAPKTGLNRTSDTSPTPLASTGVLGREGG